MATATGGTRCDKCWHPTRCESPQPGYHNPGCPDLHGALAEALSEWKRGRSFGFEDNHLEYWKWRYYSTSFVLGYRVGKDEIDTLIEIAAENRW